MAGAICASTANNRMSRESSREEPFDFHVEKEGQWGRKRSSFEPKRNKHESHGQRAASEQIAMETAEQVPPAVPQILLQPARGWQK